MAKRINVNLASEAELVELPGVGEVMAKRIMANRPFESVGDLSKVQGISSNTIEQIASLLTFAEDDGDEVIVLPPQGEIANLEELEESEEPVDDEAVAEVSDESAWDKVPKIEEPESEPETYAESEADPALGEQPVEEDVEEATEETQAEDQPKTQEKAIIPLGEPKSNGKGKGKQPKMITQADAVLLSVGSSIAAMLFSFILTLLVLWAINGGLRFVRPDQLSVVSSDISIASRQITALQEDLVSLQTRVGEFEGVSGRVTSLETDITRVKTDLSQLETQIETLENDVSTEIDSINSQVTAVSEMSDELAGQVEELQAQTSSFQEFLDGLRDLLSNVLVNPFGGDR